MLTKEKKALMTKMIFSALFFALVLYVHPVRAAIGPLLDDALIKKAQCAPNSDCSLNSFIILGVRLSDIILGVVGSLTLLMFVYGGVMLLISGGNSENVAKGKSIILGSVVGLCIVFGSYTIIKFTVNNILGAKEGYQFTGGAPGDIELEQGRAPKCVKEKGGTCIKDNAVCKNSYDQPGLTEASDCGQEEKCCIAKEPPENQTCTHVVGNRCDAVGCLPGESPDPLLLCQNRGICCQPPPS